jgi:hypothetical protein
MVKCFQRKAGKHTDLTACVCWLWAQREAARGLRDSVSEPLYNYAGCRIVLRSEFRYEPHALVLHEEFANQNLKCGNTVAPIGNFGLRSLLKRM